MLDGVDWEIKHDSSHIGYGSDWSTPKRMVALLKMILIQTHVATRPPGFFLASSWWVWGLGIQFSSL